MPGDVASLAPPGRFGHTARMRRKRLESRTDEQLLALAAGADPEAFTVFYRRHVDLVLAYLHRRTGNAEAAADLMAETFASALLSLHADERPPEIRVPVAWLLGIARNKLLESYQRGRVEAEARRRLGLEPLVLDDRDLALVEELDADALIQRLERLLPPDQLLALRARVLEEREYDEIAVQLSCSEELVRKRVSRALETLRTRARMAL
jgi:RNA polymerase sigma factor (sigma-70 family)